MTNREPRHREMWGHTVEDPYAWLENPDDPDVLQWLTSENERTEGLLADQAELREQIFEEIRSRVQETDLSPPVRKGNWLYYTRTDEALQYAIHCRRPLDSAEGEREEILLDENELAEGHEYFDLGVFEVSPDHERLLFGTDVAGDEKYTLRVKELTDHTVTDTGLTEASAGSAWAMDSTSFFYLRPDETNRPAEAWLFDTETRTDRLVYAEEDRQYFLAIGRETDDSFVQIVSGSAVTHEVRLVPADAPTSEPLVVEPRHYGREYSVAHHRGLLVILTNHEARNFRVMTTSVDRPGVEHWRELITHRDEVMLAGMELFANHLVLLERDRGALQLRVLSFAESPVDPPLSDHVIAQPESHSTVWPGNNPEFDTDSLRYGYTSMTTPNSVFSYEMETRQRTLLKEQPVLGGFDSDDYATERVWVAGHDGTDIPLSLVWKRDRPDGPGPAVLYGYGAYEISMDPAFSVARLSLLDRGFVFAIAHVRGGGELGRPWYEDGKFEHKPNSFRDFLSCARHLVASGWTTPDQLGIRGGSAGGLLVGAVLNLAPELFGAAVAEVPFVDVLNTMIDTSQQLTEIEWDEWGNPIQSEAIHDVIAGYTPYENIQSTSYPAIFVTGGLTDPRVRFWEPAKWVLRLRELTTGDDPIVLRTEMGAGHFGSTARHDAWRDEARALAFLITELT